MFHYEQHNDEEWLIFLAGPLSHTSFERGNQGKYGNED